MQLAPKGHTTIKIDQLKMRLKAMHKRHKNALVSLFNLLLLPVAVFGTETGFALDLWDEFVLNVDDA